MECGAEMRWTDDAIEEDYKGRRFSVEGVAHWQCDVCGNYHLDADGCTAMSRSLAAQYAAALMQVYRDHPELAREAILKAHEAVSA